MAPTDTVTAARPATIDLVRAAPELYAPPADPVLVVVPPLRYLMIDGSGDPAAGGDYAVALQVLFSVAYPLKFALRRAGGPDCKVMPPEGLWWADDPAAFATGDRTAWHWTMMVREPDEVTVALLDAVLSDARAKRPDLPYGRLRLETLDEGESVQLTHRGPYAAEHPNIERMHRFLADHARVPRGPHHEIYLSDPRRTAPDRLRTVLRQPCSPA